MKFSCKTKITAAKTWEIFVKVFGDSSVSRAMVFQWHSWFAASEESIEDAEQNGELGTMKTNENITRVVAVLKNNCHASCRIIVESMGVPKIIVHHILSDVLKK